MKFLPVWASIVIVLVVSTLSGALIVGIILYRSTVSSSDIQQLNMAQTTSMIISFVAAFDRRLAGVDHPDDTNGATLEKIRSALVRSNDFKLKKELMLLKMDGNNIRVLVHQETDQTKHEHLNVIYPDSKLYAVLKQGFSGRSGISKVQDNLGFEQRYAFAPVQGTDWVVAVERPIFELQKPFIQAGLFGGAITVLLAAFGGLLNYRTAMNISVEAREARDNAEIALANSQAAQQRLNDVINITSEGFAFFDKDDRLVICNDVYKEFYNTHENAIQPGNTMEDILRAGLAAGAFPRAKGREDAWLNERLAQHHATETIEQKLSDGRWLKISEKRTKDGGIVGVRTDITEIKDREIALKESEQRFKDFTETASDWVWETYADHTFKTIEGGKRREGKLTVPSGNSRRRQDLAEEDTDNEKWRNHLQDLDAHRPFEDFRYLVIMPGQGKRLVSVSGVPVFDEDGSFKGYRGTARDITNEHNAYERLNKAEVQLRLAFENVTIGVVLSDREGQIIGFNKTAEKIFGYTADEVMGKNVRILTGGEHRQLHDRYMDAYHKTGKAKIIGIGREVTGQRKNGEVFPLNLGIGKMVINDEVQYIASILDISEEKLLEQKLRQSQKMEAVGQLIGGIAHDFNNLLGIILGNLDLVLHDLEPENRMGKKVNKAIAATERGAALTRRLLNFTRQMPTDTQEININTTITDLHDLIQKALTKLVSVQLDLAENLPLAMAEKGELEDAIMNLCFNARDAMPNGGRILIETSTIEVAQDQRPELKELKPGTYVLIDVSDTGTGMPPEVVSHIFEPFFTTKEQGKGTGLGLSMVYGFAKRSGGLITVHSEVGQGTTFKLFFPAMAGENVTDKMVHEEKRIKADYSGTEKVLVVDDEKALVDIAVTVLSKCGYETLVAYNGQDALDIIIKDNTIDLLLSDIIMPDGMDGYQLADQAKAANPNLKICLMSGYAGARIIANRKVQSKYPLLPKPYSNLDLIRFVRSLLDGV